MTSSSDLKKTTLGKTGRRPDPIDFSQVSLLRSLGGRLLYILLPGLVSLVPAGYALFITREQSVKHNLSSVVQRKIVTLNQTSPRLLQESTNLRLAYDRLIEKGSNLENTLKTDKSLPENQKNLLQELQQLQTNPLWQENFPKGGSLALVDLESTNQSLYVHLGGNETAGNQVSYATIPLLRQLVDRIQTSQQVEGALSLGGSLWAYSKIGDTGMAIVASTPDTGFSATLGSLSWTLGSLIVFTLLMSLLAVLELRSKLQLLIDACEQVEKGGTPNLAVEENSDEIVQVQRALIRTFQGLAFREERLKEELTDAIRQEERSFLRRDQTEEAEFLEAEIGGLLDVVSALEDGDLTIQAEVSDRATGLVADTLNRLREQLAEIIAGVLAVAQQVADGAGALEDVARTVSENVENQAQSVVKGRAFTEQVAELAQNSAAMVGESSTALQTVETTVGQGQVAINSLTEAITVLQEGTAQIIQRMKTLGEFVGLAEQFVQDQGQIASLTQVLAINATLVAARAAEQRDPKQFIGVAREFEAIAGQVNTLATQTNDGLGVLQQRTAQIQSVVSAIDVEVQGLGRLVEGFTKGVEKSQKAFQDVQGVTTQVVETSKLVTRSSSEIATAAKSTARYISEIATLAEQTAGLTADAQSKAETMGDLAQRLLAGIRYFRLPAGAIAESTVNS